MKFLFSSLFSYFNDLWLMAMDLELEIILQISLERSTYRSCNVLSEKHKILGLLAIGGFFFFMVSHSGDGCLLLYLRARW